MDPWGLCLPPSCLSLSTHPVILLSVSACRKQRFDSVRAKTFSSNYESGSVILSNIRVREVEAKKNKDKEEEKGKCV